MKVQQGRIDCPYCGKAFSVQIYIESNESDWTLFSDGYLYYPYGAPPWHEYKLCPHCKSSVKAQDDNTHRDRGEEDLDSGDIFPPRDRIRAALEQATDSLPKSERRTLMLLDLWISNHICSSGCDDYTRSKMKDLLDLDLELDPVIRADVQRQLGRLEAAREGLQHIQRGVSVKDTDSTRRLHIKSVLAFCNRGVRAAFPVVSEGDFMPPTGRLAIHKAIVSRNT